MAQAPVAPPAPITRPLPGTGRVVLVPLDDFPLEDAMDRGCLGVVRASPERRLTRLRRMVARNVGVLHYHLPLSDDPRSLLYRHVRNPHGLDAMRDDFRARGHGHAEPPTREMVVAVGRGPCDLQSEGTRAGSAARHTAVFPPRGSSP